MIPDVKAQAEENIVPYKHLHFGIFSRIDSHHITINNGNGTTGGCRYEITMNFENGPFTKESFGKIFAG